jgi:hypothetical protein
MSGSFCNSALSHVRTAVLLGLGEEYSAGHVKRKTHSHNKDKLGSEYLRWRQ